ncbi:unnamed protein product [Allacma fusca]|uniref:Uncharacterized protein n=1 Tax=Allacma fusca TaxID=39272 RepID=A0A8J2KC06_9HEXA|nr:unnamed protein product [Allacma fusca]
MKISNYSEFYVDLEVERASLEDMKSFISRIWSPENLDSNIHILYSMGIVGVFQPIVHLSYRWYPLLRSLPRTLDFNH